MLGRLPGTNAAHCSSQRPPPPSRPQPSQRRRRSPAHGPEPCRHGPVRHCTRRTLEETVTRDEALKICRVLGATYRRDDWSEERFEVWIALLEDLPFDQAQEAVLGWARNEK